MAANEEKRTFILAGLITAALLSLIPISAWFENRRQDRIDREGGIVGIVNKSDHTVALELFGHDSTGIVIRTDTLAPMTEWILLYNMSKAEVTAFTPKGVADSAILTFDDTLSVIHKGVCPWEVKYDDHCIQNREHWMYESLIVRQGGFRGRKTIYRPARVYTLTNNDYNRAINKTTKQ